MNSLVDPAQQSSKLLNDNVSHGHSQWSELLKLLKSHVYIDFSVIAWFLSLMDSARQWSYRGAYSTLDGQPNNVHLWYSNYEQKLPEGLVMI